MDDAISTVAEMDSKGRLTLKEAERKALGVNDLEDDEKAIIVLDARVKRVEDDGS